MVKSVRDDENVTLNFRVNSEFRWAYKLYAAENSIMMNWTLQRSFEVYRGLVELDVLDRDAERKLMRSRFKAPPQAELSGN